MQKIITNFISNQLFWATNILHFGSSLQNKKFNDIDLIVISERHSSFVKETTLYEGIMFEVFIFPKKKIFQILEVNKKVGVYHKIIEEGLILRDKDDLLINLKKKIKIIDSFPVLKKYELQHNIRSTVKEIFLTEKGLEKEVLINDLLKLIIDLKLLSYDWNIYEQTKHKLRRINDLYPDFISKFYDLKKRYLITLNKNDLIKGINDELLPINSFLNQSSYSSSYHLNFPDKDLIVFLKNISYDEFLPIFNFLSNRFNFCYSFSVKNNYSLLEKGIYIKLNSINKEQLLKINEYFNRFVKTHPEVLINYPYQLNVSSYLGLYKNEDINDVENVLSLLYSVIKNDIFNEKKMVLKFLNYILGNYIFYSERELLIEDLKEYGNFFGHNFIDDSYDRILFNKVFNFSFSKYDAIQKNIISIYQHCIYKWDFNLLPDDSINSVIKKNNFMNLENRENIFMFAANLFSLSDYDTIFIFHLIGKLITN